MENEIKDTLRRTALFGAVLFVAFLVLFCVSFLTRPSVQSGLRESVQMVLDAAAPGTYEAGPYVQLGTALPVSAFEVASDGHPAGYAAVARVTGIAGAVPAVVLVVDWFIVSYAGMAGTAAPLAEPRLYGLTNDIIGMWARRIGTAFQEISADEKTGQ